MTFKVGFSVSIECSEGYDTPAMRAVAFALVRKLKKLLLLSCDSCYQPTPGHSRRAARVEVARALTGFLNELDGSNFFIVPQLSQDLEACTEDSAEFAFVLGNRWADKEIGTSLACSPTLRHNGIVTWGDLASQQSEVTRLFYYLTVAQQGAVWDSVQSALAERGLSKDLAVSKTAV